MILSDIRNYLEKRGQASLADIALHFEADPDAVRGMLDVWIRKNRVHKQMATLSCGDSCTQCDPTTTEIYVWTRSATKLHTSLPSGCGHR